MTPEGARPPFLLRLALRRAQTDRELWQCRANAYGPILGAAARSFAQEQADKAARRARRLAAELAAMGVTA